MEIEVGDYVRTKNGLIRKVKTIYSGKRANSITTETRINSSTKLEDIVNHSHNIIHLIQDEEIVELEYYVRKYGKRITRKFEISRLDNKAIYFDNRHCSFCYDLKENKWRDGKGYNPKIKLILTKKKFEQNSYKVEE